MYGMEIYCNFTPSIEIVYMEKRPLLLVSNDDGVNAKGIHELIKVLRPLADLIVVAPDGPVPVLPEQLLQSILCGV